MNVKELIYEFAGLEDAGEMVDKAHDSTFSKLKEELIAVNGDSIRFQDNLKKGENEYMTEVHGSLPSMSGTGALDRKGNWKFRTYSVDDDANGVHRQILTDHNIKFKLKEVKISRKGVKGTNYILEIYGLPPGYYTAKRTLINAVDYDVVGWEHLQKSELEKEITKLKRAEKPVNPEKETRKAFIKAFELYKELQETEEKEEIQAMVEYWVRHGVYIK